MGNQSAIEEDLKGLPIFLSGCKELLVLGGPSYLSRLWCVVELFTFVHMRGGRTDGITFIRIPNTGEALEEDDFDEEEDEDEDGEEEGEEEEDDPDFDPSKVKNPQECKQQ